MVTPATAEGDVTVGVPDRVVGRDALVLSVDGLRAPVAITVEITDAEQSAARWRFSPPAVADETLRVDLGAPDSGEAPVNGDATVTVSAPVGTLATATTVIDRTPATPTLKSVVRAQRVGLTWDPVAAADQVTYRLERIAASQSWTVVHEGHSADGYTDRDLDPGRYRYRLSAAVPAADDGLNWSAPSAVQVKIVAPSPSPSPRSSPSPTPADDPSPATKAKAKPGAEPEPKAQQPPRNVAATGQVRGSVSGADDARREARPTPLRATADAPALDGSLRPETSGAPAVAAPPEVAPPAAPSPDVAPPATEADAVPVLEPFPVTVPPAGSLAVHAATQSPEDLV